ncbi:hypothetical protein GGR42_000832 [Saonia flava]|uniref:Uncharacterized protein n=1 Tax=Saonia flava TaxID=523696 RepID=A0A846QTS7_9FLAO|nr:hypothetical protein [Saonia flava]
MRIGIVSNLIKKPVFYTYLLEHKYTFKILINTKFHA